MPHNLLVILDRRTLPVTVWVDETLTDEGRLTKEGIRRVAQAVAGSRGTPGA